MAIIQMLNDEVIDLKESGDELFGLIIRTTQPVIEVTAVDDAGESKMWINPAAISSFMG